MRYLALASLAFFGLSAVAQADLSQGLRNYWNFDDNLEDSASDFGGASTVEDDGAFDGANGTGGISFDTGLFGQAIALNGAAGAAQDDGHVVVTRSADTLYGGTSTLTTSLWVQTAGVDTGWQTIISHGEGSQYRIARRGSDNPPTVAYAGGSGEGPASPTAILDDSWHHVVAVSEGGVNTRLYYDGQLVSTGGAPTINDDGNSNPAAPDLFIGANPQTGAQTREWFGSIDDVAQWDLALSEVQIQNIYNAGLAGNSLGTIIPEPSSVVLLVCGGLLALGWRLRR